LHALVEGREAVFVLSNVSRWACLCLDETERNWT